MKVARIAVLGVAIAAGGAAAIMMGGGDKPAPQPVAEQPKSPRIDILVAGSDLPLGQSVKVENVRWQAWPADVPATGLIKKSESPNAIDEVAGSIVRNPILNGEPIRREKLIKGNGGFMSAILPAGMRAVAISIDNRGSTSAGGFILPNDRVDLIQTIRGADQAGSMSTTTLLTNIRVLAIGQNVQERNGEKVVTGETATLELTPLQAETVILAQKVGQLSLVLRAMADVNDTSTPMREEKTSNRLEVIRFGVSQQATVQP
ncbi:MAG TPA: Flp pilus assembly protein CpaB [Microvirga sp.]|jgi:pilus assembly protein CpaB|nr:Flp pilus assembly protein CpaB [Microvirga sp.]